MATCPRTLAAFAAALFLIGAPALAQKQTAPKESVRPQVVLLYPGSNPSDSEAIVVPAASPLRLAKFQREEGVNVTFNGRFTLSGAFEVEDLGEEATVTFYPDQSSRDRLPYWRDRGGPEELYLSNGRAFVEAVASPAELQLLKSGKGPVRGRVTIVADNYQTGIECDAAHFSARFVSVVKRPVQIAALPAIEEGC